MEYRYPIAVRSSAQNQDRIVIKNIEPTITSPVPYSRVKSSPNFQRKMRNPNIWIKSRPKTPQPIEVLHISLDRNYNNHIQFDNYIYILVILLLDTISKFL
jgi:hypothetical protein